VEIHESKYLENESEIVAYFKDSGNEFFECGQGYYQDEAEVIAKIGNDYFIVELYAEVVSSKQDVGDRLYWVDEIYKVTYSPLSEAKVKEMKNKDITSRIANLQKQIDELKEQYV